MGSGNSRAYLIGVSHIVVGLSATVEVKPRAGVLDGFLELHSVAGASNFVSLVNGASQIWSTGYYLRDDDKVDLDGPAKFYLAAAGATMTVNYVMKYSAGASFG